MNQLQRSTAAAAAAITVATAPAACADPGTSSTRSTECAAVQLVRQASESMRTVNSAHVMFSSTGIEDLMATSYSADITSAPRSARGTANLLIDGERVNTGFQVSNRRLLVRTDEGKFVDVGAARTRFDPSVLIDPDHGLAALLQVVCAFAEAPSTEPDVDGVVLHAKVPAAAATLLIPQEAMGAVDELPIDVWLTTGAHTQMAQVIATAGTGTVTLKFAAPRTDET